MCGIAGIITFKKGTDPKLQMIHSATDCLAKRGPDDRGIFIDESVALGHRRLSIIDVSHNAAQPMTETTGRYQIIFNGEFFNYADFRQQLISDGISFRTSSDTEVVLQLYIKYGVECLKMINGFFALAIYDSWEKTVFIARDRMGVKPLLYWKSEELFCFASELKSLLAMGIPKKINKETLHLYLQLNYVPPDACMLKDVYKVNPGSYLFIKIGGVEITSKNYYRIPLLNNYDAAPSYHKSKEHIVELMDKSVQRRLVGDVPLGAFLSGGLDSSVIVALASKHVAQLNTYSIGFRDNKHFDETHFAEMVATKYKTNHHVFRLSDDDVLGCIFDVLDYIDEPFADSSALNVFILSRETRKHVTVALSGDGADEIFGGYRKHRAEWMIRNRKLFSAVLSTSAKILSGLEGSRHTATGNRFRQLKRFNEGASLSPAARYWQWCCITGTNAATQLMKDPPMLAEDQILNYTKNISEDFNSILHADMQLVLTGDMLVKVDQMSMANSLEVRNPFLDFELVDYAFSLPSKYKINRKEQKRIIRDAFRELLPAELFSRSKKGFEVPLLHWLTTSLQPLINDDLLEENFIREQGIWNLSSVQALKAELISVHPGDAAARVWALIVFQYWYKKYFS
jgi:asparagine synthase (glutamine-hydrolysing)